MTALMRGARKSNFKDMMRGAAPLLASLLLSNVHLEVRRTLSTFSVQREADCKM